MRAHKGSIQLNVVQEDRISFSVLRNDKNEIRKIENISYEINYKNRWEWIVRFDDHGGAGKLHAHFRISLNDQREVDSNIPIPSKFNKNEELTWVCEEIKHNYIKYREELLKKEGVDLY